jgi:hypothetical protein
MSARGGRATSGPWSRLKHMNVDPLEAVGFPSKGDKRLVGLIVRPRAGDARIVY